MDGKAEASEPKGAAVAEAAQGLRVLRHGPAMRVIFFYPGEEGTYVDQVNVILFENGIVHLYSDKEETTTHLQNCEILWRIEAEKEDKKSAKVRLLKPKGGVEPSPEGEPPAP
jgi:hypothetical protein